VAERHGAAVHVDALFVDAELAQYGHGLDRERLVQLEEVDRAEVPPDLLRQPADGVDRRHEHELRCKAARRLANDAGEGG